MIKPPRLHLAPTVLKHGHLSFSVFLMVVFLNWNGDIVYHSNGNDELDQLPSSPVELFFLTASVLLRSGSTPLGTVVTKLDVWVWSVDVERVVTVSPVLLDVWVWSVDVERVVAVSPVLLDVWVWSVDVERVVAVSPVLLDVWVWSVDAERVVAVSPVLLDVWVWSVDVERVVAVSPVLLDVWVWSVDVERVVAVSPVLLDVWVWSVDVERVVAVSPVQLDVWVWSVDVERVVTVSPALLDVWVWSVDVERVVAVSPVLLDVWVWSVDVERVVAVSPVLLDVWVWSVDVERVVAVSPVLDITPAGVVMLGVISVVLWLSLLGLFLRLYWISPRASSPCAAVEKEPVLVISTVSGVWDDGYVSPHELPSVSGTRPSPEKLSVETKALGSGVWSFCSGISVTTTQSDAVAWSRLVWLSLGPSLVAFGATVVGTTELVGGKEVINWSVTVEGPGSHERLHHDINPIETNTTSAVRVNYT